MHYMIHVELARRLSSEKPPTGSSDAVLTSPAPRGWRRLLSKGARTGKRCVAGSHRRAFGLDD